MKINNIEMKDAVSGHFQAVLRVTARVIGPNRQGVPYLKLRLETCHSQLTGFLNMETHSMPADIGYLELVEVSGHIVSTAKQRFLLIEHLEKAGKESRQRLPALETLPQSCAAKANSLERLVH